MQLNEQSAASDGLQAIILSQLTSREPAIHAIIPTKVLYKNNLLPHLSSITPQNGDRCHSF